MCDNGSLIITRTHSLLKINYSKYETGAGSIGSSISNTSAKSITLYTLNAPLEPGQALTTTLADTQPAVSTHSTEPTVRPNKN